MTRTSATVEATSEGVVEWDGLRTWYRVVGDLDAATGKPAVVIVHGGPGATHDYLEPLSELAAADRACVFYDQVGCGRSTHDRGAPKSFWAVDLFLAELERLVEHLGLDDYHLLGQSWGAMLGLEHALLHPSGLRSLVLANGTASIPRYVEENAKLLAALPDGAGTALVAHGRAGTTDDPAFQAAIVSYSRRHRLRLDDTPEPLLRTQAAMEDDSTVYAAMAGSEFYVSGSLASWDVTDRLPAIDVPVLLITGEYDELPPVLAFETHERLQRSRVVIVDGASHMTHLEQPEAFRDLVTQHLTETERAQS